MGVPIRDAPEMLDKVPKCLLMTVSYCSGVEGRTHGKSYPSLVWRRSSAASGISSSEDEEPNGNGAQARDGDSTDEAADLSEPFIREYLC